MKTPMQELIDEMQKSPLMFASALTLVEKMRMLEKEKETIVEAWNSAYGGDAHYYGEDYYNETFNTEKK